MKQDPGVRNRHEELHGFLWTVDFLVSLMACWSHLAGNATRLRMDEVVARSEQCDERCVWLAPALQNLGTAHTRPQEKLVGSAKSIERFYVAIDREARPTPARDTPQQGLTSSAGLLACADRSRAEFCPAQ